MNKYKVGQKVRIKEDISVGSNSSHDIFFAKGMEKYKGKIVTIKETSIFKDEYQYYIAEDLKEYLWDEEWFEPVDIVKTKKDLQDGDIVTLVNGDRLVYANGCFRDLNDENLNDVCDVSDLNDDLTYTYNSNSRKNNVVKVERPETYYEVFNREETAKELTVEEISKLLGYKVKIIERH